VIEGASGRETNQKKRKKESIAKKTVGNLIFLRRNMDLCYPDLPSFSQLPDQVLDLGQTEGPEIIGLKGSGMKVYPVTQNRTNVIISSIGSSLFSL
jgi:hypothetical protein